jgi:cell division transport system permease protein
LITEFGAILRRSWQSHFWTNLATTAILTLSFSLILGAILVTTNLSRLFSVWGEEIQITVYLKDDISADDVRSIKSNIENQTVVERVLYVDKTAAAASFEKSLSSYGPTFMKSLKDEKESPFPASYQVRIRKEDKTPEKIEALAQDFAKLTGVEDVSYGQEWLNNYSILLKASKTLAVLFTLALLSACLFTVSNSIQASLFSRRDEIEILELVGATSKTIRRPFLIEGAFQGLVAIVFSILVLGIIYKTSFQSLERILGASSVLSALEFLTPVVVLISILVGVLIGALGSYICVARLNTGWAAAEEGLP